MEQWILVYWDKIIAIIFPAVTAIYVWCNDRKTHKRILKLSKYNADHERELQLLKNRLEQHDLATHTLNDNLNCLFQAVTDTWHALLLVESFWNGINPQYGSQNEKDAALTEKLNNAIECNNRTIQLSNRNELQTPSEIYETLEQLRVIANSIINGIRIFGTDWINREPDKSTLFSDYGQTRKNLKKKIKNAMTSQEMDFKKLASL